jgi:hypothetical protein
MGFFYKIKKSDLFVLLDKVNVPRGQSFANRNKILGPNGPFYLTVPLNKKKFNNGIFTYLEAEFSDQTWREKHLKSIEISYKKSPYFNLFFPVLQNLYEKNSLSFCEHNIRFIEEVCTFFNIKTPIIRLSKILDKFGQKNQLIIDIAGAINANVYLCGSGGGLEYTDPEFLLQQANIKTIFTSFVHPSYPQFNSKEFFSHLSIIDYIFNCGNKKDFLN